MPTAIPVRNIYFLLCYAYNRLTELGLVDVSASETTELVDLFARILISGVSRLRRRGFERGYAGQVDELPGIRGRIQMRETVLRLQDRHGRATCSYDELTIDTPQNRVVKAAMRRLCAVDNLDPDHRGKLKLLIKELQEVRDCSLTRSLFREVRLHANNRHYRFLIDIAALVLDCTVPDEQTGRFRFRDFSREGPEMAQLFESFVRNFLRIERPDLDVGSEDISWIASSDQDPSLSLLPDMRTDITVRSSDRTLVIDTKFYEQTLQTYFDKQTVYSGNLYQLVTYLRNMESGGGKDARAEGMLLYPVTTDSLDVSYVVENHKVRVKTIDLLRDWQEVAKQVHSLVV